MKTIEVQKRDLSVKAKKLRREGIIPCVIYGTSLDASIPIQMNGGDALALFREYRIGSKVNIHLENQLIPTQIKERVLHYEHNDITHISFQALQDDKRVNSVAHILLKNTDKVFGILEKMVLEVPYLSLPDDMIDTVTLDLDKMEAGTTVTLLDIPEFNTDAITLQLPTDTILVRVLDKIRLNDEGEAE